MTEKTVYQQLTIAIVNFITFAINIFLGILIMTKGWGVEAQSYKWIIGGGASVALVTWGFTAIMKTIYGDISDD